MKQREARGLAFVTSYKRWERLIDCSSMIMENC